MLHIFDDFRIQSNLIDVEHVSETKHAVNVQLKQKGVMAMWLSLTPSFGSLAWKESRSLTRS